MMEWRIAQARRRTFVGLLVISVALGLAIPAAVLHPVPEYRTVEMNYKL